MAQLRANGRQQSGFAHLGLLLLLLLVAAVIIFAGLQLAKRHAAPAVQTANKAETQHALKGVGLSPKSYGSADFTAFLSEAATAGSVISWTGSWTALEQSGSAPYIVASLAAQYRYTPISIVGTHQDAGGKLTASLPMTAANEQRFVKAISGFAGTYHPAYLGIGNEVNRIYDASPADYAALRQWFADAAAAVKRQSPQTKLFTTFQYEQLNGLRGGLFGGANDPSANRWELLADFPAADFIAFTSYPYLVYRKPADIPQDYYTRIRSHTAKPVAFTEIGWLSGAEAAGYAGTPADQVAFITAFAADVSRLHSVFVIWPFLYNQHLAAPFSSVSLFAPDGSAKPALSAWQAATF